jgi:hypothetical protein
LEIPMPLTLLMLQSLLGRWGLRFLDPIQAKNPKRQRVTRPRDAGNALV